VSGWAGEKADDYDATVTMGSQMIPLYPFNSFIPLSLKLPYFLKFGALCYYEGLS
jgi:hypothetical protein